MCISRQTKSGFTECQDSNTNLVAMLFVSSMLFCKVVSDPIFLSSTFNLKFTVSTLDGAIHGRVRVANLFQFSSLCFLRCVFRIVCLRSVQCAQCCIFHLSFIHVIITIFFIFIILSGIFVLCKMCLFWLNGAIAISSCTCLRYCALQVETKEHIFVGILFDCALVFFFSVFFFIFVLRFCFENDHVIFFNNSLTKIYEISHD